MKKFFFFIVCLFVTIGTMAEGFPTLSVDGDEHWYYLKFTQGAYVVASDGNGVVCKSAIPTGQKSELWKVESASAGGYTFTNQLGLQLYATATSQGSEIRASLTPGSLNRFRINTQGANYTITPYSNTGQAFNCWGGMGLGNDIKLYDSADTNAPMAFISEAEMTQSSPVVNVIPYPKEVSYTYCNQLDMHKVEAITFFDDSTRILAQTLADDLLRTSGINIILQQVEKGMKEEENDSRPKIQMYFDEQTPTEAYALSACGGGITITASSFGGFFNGLQTLRQMLPTAIYGQTLQENIDWTCESVTMYDEPQLKHRGFHLDVSRHFFSKEEVKKLLDAASVYKLNRFHWHLTDDQGWRIEIPEYPLLTTIGAVRSRSLTINDPTNNTEFYDDTEYGRGCFYTLDDLREVVAYAKERNIEIIPEVDLPGHMVAAIAAYPELSCDPTKNYEVRVAKGISTDVLNVGKDEVIDFLKCVLGHVAEVFPYNMIHIGGDECPTTAWTNNAECLQRVRDEGLTGVNQLQAWLVEKLGSYLRDEYGKTVIVWDELLSNWNSSFTIKPVIMAWRGTSYITQAADKGFQSIAVPTSPLYFDLLQISPDKMEIDAPYFGGYGDNSVNSVDRVYNFNPLAQVSGREQFVLGTQANLWTESCTENREAEYCLYPRLIALSETAWTPNDKKDFASFYTRLQHHADILDAKGIFYAKHYFQTPELSVAEEALKEAEILLKESQPGKVGYPAQSDYDLLSNAYNALKADMGNESLCTALQNQLAYYKTAPITLPLSGHAYRILSASTYYRNRYEGSSLYADGSSLRIHYTEQTEPEELWQFTQQPDGSYIISSMLNKQQLSLPSTAGSAATFAEIGSGFNVRKAVKPAGGYDYIPGVVNIKFGNLNLYAKMTGQIVGDNDSTLCYPGTWRIVEVTDFAERLQGLADKAEHIISTSKPGKIGDPTPEALEFLRTEVLEPALEALQQGNVTEETYLYFTAKYQEFLQKERLSILNEIDEDRFYLICNAYHTTYYAYGNANSKIVVPRTLAQTDGYKWAFVKNGDGTVMIKNKLSNTFAYVNADAVDERIRLGNAYKWTLGEATTDLGDTGIVIIDGSGTYSWYTNPSAWTYVLLKPYDWGASIWKLIKTTEEVPDNIISIELPTQKSSPIYDLQGRRVTTPQKGLYIRNGKKFVVK